jgi:hypothetical protein
MREHGVRLLLDPGALGPGAVGREPHVLREVLGEAQDHRPRVLDHGHRAIAAHVAHGDSALPRGGEIDAVGARSGDRDQLELARAQETLTRQLDFVDQHDLRIGDALGELRIGRQRIEVDSRRRPLETRGVEIAVGNGFVIEEYRTHGATMPVPS